MKAGRFAELTRWAAAAAVLGMVVGSAGLLGQVVAILFGATESPALIAALGTLAGASLTALSGLAALVWNREQKRGE